MMDLTAFSDERLATWLQTFVDKLRRHASALGVSGPEVAEVERESRSMSELVAGEKQVERSDVDPQLKREFSQYRDLLRDGPARDLQRQYPAVFTDSATQVAPGIVPRVVQFVESLRQRSGISSDTVEKLGLAGLGAGSVAALMKDPGRFADWFGRFLPGLQEKRSELGISAGEVASLDKDYRTTTHLVSQTTVLKSQGASGGMFDKLQGYTNMILNGPSDNLKRAFPAVLSIFAAAAPGIIPKLTQLLGRLQANPKAADLLGRELGLSEVVRRPAIPVREPEAARRWLWPLLGLLAVGLLGWWWLSQAARRVQTPQVRMPVAGVTPPRVPVTPAAALSLSGLQFAPTTDGGRLTWRTNRAATSQVELGRTPNYEMGRFPRSVGSGEGDLVTYHQMGLAGLPKGTYYVKAHSVDASGREVASAPYSFTKR